MGIDNDLCGVQISYDPTDTSVSHVVPPCSIRCRGNALQNLLAIEIIVIHTPIFSNNMCITIIDKNGTSSEEWQ